MAASGKKAKSGTENLRMTVDYDDVVILPACPVTPRGWDASLDSYGATTEGTGSQTTWTSSMWRMGKRLWKK